MPKTISLVDYLAYRVGVDYISDLCCYRYNHRLRLRQVIRTLRPEEFTLAEWNDALNYLTDHTFQISNVVEAKETLLKCME